MQTYILQILGKPDKKTGESPVVEQRPHEGETLAQAVDAVLAQLSKDAHGYCLMDHHGVIVHRWVSTGPFPPNNPI